jgi:hypothetical protein
VIEIIKTYTGRARAIEVKLAYRCTRCERIFLDIKNREAAIYHDCKGPK